MTSMIPYLTFRHGGASLSFLEEVLGFDVIVAQHGDDGALVHVEMRRGDALLMGGPGDASPTTSPGLYLVVEDVDMVYQSALSHGGVGGYPPEETPWGTRRARFYDLDGHEWSVGTYQPGESWD